MRPHWRNALGITVNRFTVGAQILHFVMAVTYEFGGRSCVAVANRIMTCHAPRACRCRARWRQIHNGYCEQLAHAYAARASFSSRS